MSTYGVMLDRVLDEVNRTDLATAARAAIGSAIQFYGDEPLEFNQERATATTADGTEFYALPSGFVSMQDLMLTLNSYRYQLVPATVGWMNHYYTAASQYKGRPEHYVIQDRQIRLYPIPNDAWELTAHYMRQLTEVTADATTVATNAWMIEGEELIRTRAKWDLYFNLLHDDQKAGKMDQHVGRCLLRLQGRSDQRLRTGRIRPWL